MKILVTGAGGSIGSALCRKIAAGNPELLMMFELSEYALYKIDQELSCERLAVLGDVKDARRLEQLPRPDLIFHCAAYKHVPMLEAPLNVEQAYQNNVKGTEVVMASFTKAHRIVLLSSDKAVNPVSVMGRSKLMAEGIAKIYGRSVARLGNILESSGSVVPKFREQIAKGGPVTVTDSEATRYFMPINEAVDFILGVAEKDPGVYQAKMGDPVRILDLAKQMIGDRDIKIEFTGLRPGEKLHEQLEAA